MPDDDHQPPSVEELIQASTDLDERQASNPEWRTLVSFSRRTRRLARGATFISVAVAALALVLAAVVLKVDHNADRISRTNAYAVADAANLQIICERANDDLAKQRALWSGIIDYLSRPSTTGTLADKLTPAVATLPDSDPSKAVWEFLVQLLATPNPASTSNGTLVDIMRPLVEQAYTPKDCNPTNAPVPTGTPP